VTTTGEVAGAFKLQPEDALCAMNGVRITPPDATFKNGRYVLPAHARGVLVLADPPEAGWRLEDGSHDTPPDDPGHDRDDETP
jgi:hypothetical protein